MFGSRPLGPKCVVDGHRDPRCMMTIPSVQNVCLRGCLDKWLVDLAGPCNQKCMVAGPCGPKCMVAGPCGPTCVVAGPWD